ncbi:probable ATP-dependent RNA helicase DDX20 [Drosophila miranda]|uniref:probable ATP-dependent RNA helicase DDX20 n=1 Tax=Drosophila miranda TaxID=7229 RepID=UPI0007E7E2AE|nr:probable ATP-dependent RNA helicase DDX20 [Drosophila miranda]
MEGAIAHNLANGQNRTSDVEAGQMKHFSALHLRRQVLSGLAAENFRTPTKIQAAAIPMALTGMDLLVQSKSGTGKTLIYVVTALQMCRLSTKHPEVLVILPTRELALQVHDTFRFLGEKLRPFKVSSFIGGTDVTKDREKLRNCHVAIGTPGRLLQLHEKGVLNLSMVKLLVLDEADQLYVTASLQKTVNALIAVLPLQRQIIACSATFDQNLDEKIAKIMEKPILISNSERATVLLGIRQFVYELPEQVNNLLEMRLKLEALKKIFAQLNYEQAVLFSNSKMRADSYCSYLNAGKIPCTLLSGDLAQQNRSEVFEGYRNFSVRTIVATDLIARGVDSHHANLVINLDPPTDHITYLHRTGRAGRFGSKAIAITFISSAKQSENFKNILAKAGTGMSVLQFPTEGPPAKDFNYFEFDAYQFPYYFKTEACEQDNNELNRIKKPKSTMLAIKIAEENAEHATDGTPVEEKTQDPMEQIDEPKIEETSPQAKEEFVKPEVLSPAQVAEERPTNLQFEILTYPPMDEANNNPPEDTNRAFEVLSLPEPVGEIPALNEEKPSTSSAAKKKEKQRRTSETQKAAKAPKSPCPEEPQPCFADNKENRPLNGVETATESRPGSNQTVMAVDGSPQTSKTISDGTAKPPESQQMGLEEDSPQTSQTPTEASQEPTQSTGCSVETHPGPPVNSINTKTYCLVVPATENSSTTLQPHVLSNTVDDASSIVSDSLECGYASDASYVSHYTENDGQIIWQRFRARQRLLKRRRRNRKAHRWNEKFSRFVRVKPAFRSGRKPGIDSLLPVLAHHQLLTKFENRESIIKRLNAYKTIFKVKNESDWLDALYRTAMEVYYTNYGPAAEQDKSERQRRQQLPPVLGKLSVHVAHQMDIPAAAAPPAAVVVEAENEADDEADTSESALTSGDEEVFEEMSSPSSGFGENTEESASSGIETSVYDPSGSSNAQDNDDDDDEEDYDNEEDYDDEEVEDEEEENNAFSNTESTDNSFVMRNVRHRPTKRAASDRTASSSSNESNAGRGHISPDRTNANDACSAPKTDESIAEETDESIAAETDESSAPEDRESVQPDVAQMNRAKKLWEETFNRQYLIIANHVANHMAQFQDEED